MKDPDTDTDTATATEMPNTTETSAKDRRDLWASLAVFALTGGVVVYTYVVRLIDQLADAFVTTRVEFADSPGPTIPSPAGAEVQFASTSTIRVPVADLSPVTTGFLRAADALQTAGYLAVLALLAWVVARFVRGHLFDALAVRLVWIASIAAIATLLVPQIPRTLGTNMLIRDVDLRSYLDFAPLGPEFWYGYVFCMALSAIAVALRIGSRLAHDSEGLV